MLSYSFSLTGRSENGEMVWRDGSLVRSTGCSFREHRVNPQHPHSTSQPTVTAVLGDPTTSSFLSGHQAFIGARHICRKNTYTYKINTFLMVKCTFQLIFFNSSVISTIYT